MAVYMTDIETRLVYQRLSEVSMTFGFRTIASSAEVDSEVAADVAVLQEFLELLRERESKRRNWYRRSPQIKHREFVIDFMMQVCTERKLPSEAMYQAIYLMDRFMDLHDIVKQELGKVAIVCIILSAKLIGGYNRTLMYRLMRHFLFRTPEFVTTEAKELSGFEGTVLKAFDFDILVPTEYNFLEAFLLYIVDGMCIAVEEEVNNHLLMMPNSNVATGDSRNLDLLHCFWGAEKFKKMKKLAMMILEQVTRIGEPTNDFMPSQIAAAIILAARREHGLNFWTDTLERVTSYNLDAVYLCLKRYIEPILSRLELKQPFDAPDFLNYMFEIVD